MFESVIQAEELLADAVADLEAGVLTGDDATRLLRTFVHIERLAVAGRAKVARRIDQSNVWRRTGHKSAALFLADQSGESLGQSMALLDTAEQLGSLPETAHAFAQGELSLTQTKEIASAAAANPAAEDRLLHQARHQTLQSLKQACRAIKNAAASQEEDQARYRRVHQARYWREWTEGGAVHGRYLLTPDAGAAAHAQIKVLANQYFQQARADGRHEPPEAYAADALVHLLTGTRGPAIPAAISQPAGRAMGAPAGASSRDDPAPEGPAGAEWPVSGTAGIADDDQGASHRFARDAGDSPAPGAGLPGDLLAAVGYPYPIADPARAKPARGAGPPTEAGISRPGGATPPPRGRPADAGRRNNPAPPAVTHPSPGPRAVVHLRVDYTVLKRGWVQDGEVCEVLGVGAVPAATAAWLAEDCWLKVLVTDGEDIRAVAHAGRTIPARLRTALEERDRQCVIPGCAVRHGLEIHHYPDYRQGTPASLATCCRVCQWHHYLITYCGYRLEGGVGNWRWIAPRDGDLTEESADDPALDWPAE